MKLNIQSSDSAKKLPQDVNPKGVFACNELDLREVQVYGFDYDYTLACYKPSMDYLLYNLGRDMLIQKYKVKCELCCKRRAEHLSPENSKKIVDALGEPTVKVSASLRD